MRLIFPHDTYYYVGNIRITLNLHFFVFDFLDCTKSLHAHYCGLTCLLITYKSIPLETNKMVQKNNWSIWECDHCGGKMLMLKKLPTFVPARASIHVVNHIAFVNIQKIVINFFYNFQIYWSVGFNEVCLSREAYIESFFEWILTRNIFVFEVLQGWLFIRSFSQKCFFMKVVVQVDTSSWMMECKNLSSDEWVMACGSSVSILRYVL